MINKNTLTWTCTGGRRLNYFIHMIDSFLCNCLDKDMIDNWIYIDDRSSDSDLEYIKKNYSFIKIIPNKKHGQLNSIKLLLENINSQFVLHTEDDWIFNIKDKFISKCFEVYNCDNRIKQVTLRHWDCPFIKHNNLSYHMHVYSPLPMSEYDIIKTNDCTYGGLSMNPSLINVEVLKECIDGIEQVDIDNRSWDKKMANKFWALGYRRANLTKKYVDHIGKESFYKRNNDYEI